MVKHSIVSLSDSEAVALSPSITHAGTDITIQNINSSGYVYIGNDSVTTTNYGYRLSPNNAISFELPGTDSLYAVSSADGLEVAVIMTALEVGD